MQRCKSAGGLCKGAKVDTGRDSTACYPREIEAARLARSANPTRGKVKGGPGSGMLAGERTRRSRAPTRGRRWLFVAMKACFPD